MSPIGREREIEAVQTLLAQPDVRLLTMTGPGGVGKTRLALAVAEHARDAFRDGVALVLLAPLSDQTLVIPTIAAAFNISEASGVTPLDRLAAGIGVRRLLLVIDNVEHVIDTSVADL
ncbi:MAG: AAA family ATPase [Chloroflexota bacterium]|nr:AAA family ATPase [Chloroflexota bacterium]